MDRESALTNEGLHAAIIASAPRASDGDNRVGAFRSHRNVETAATFIEARNPAAALDIRRHQTGRCADNTAAAHRQNANAWLAHRDPRDPAAEKEARSVMRRRSPARRNGIAESLSPPGRQNSIARIDDGKCFGSAANNLHRIDRGNAVGAGRQRLPRLDARGRT